WEDASNNKVSFHEKPNTLFRRLAWRLGSSRVIRIMKARRSSATLGQLPYGRIKLSPYALTQKHIVLHELGHILGLLHVHQRPDRDNYILVNKEKLFDSNLMKIHDQYWRLLGLIIPGRKGSNYYTDNYDFDSIMHYRNVTYSDGNHRFTDLEGNFIEVGGVEISSMDALAIQNLYSR
ncbi:MAG: M12 family metallopeptidase, partial [Halanaerobiaceae bacterium]